MTNPQPAGPQGTTENTTQNMKLGTGLPDGFSPVPEILDELRAGRIVVLTDDERRENEGDLVIAADFATPEALTFMLSVGRGYMCLCLTESDCERLALTPQTPVNTSVRGTPLTVTIDGHPKHGFTTGVSAHERAKGIKLAIDPTSGPNDFVRPGHINPLRSRDGGVLVRIGQTEGTVDLCRLAGLTPAGVLIEVMRDDGEMARVPDLIELCKAHSLKMCSVAQIIEYRLQRQSMLTRLDPASGTTIRTPEGEFNLIAFQSPVDPLPHLALTVGGVGDLDADGAVIERDEPTLVRVHRRDLLGDVFGDLDASGSGATGDTLRAALRQVQQAGRGAVVYLRPQGGSGSLRERLTRASSHSDEDTPRETLAPGMVEYGTGSQILRSLGLRKLRLLTNSATEYPQLDAFGLQIVGREPIG
ncbi:MAG: 3,4-dihydroxy-2-butanone-4-phosphate synthase [Planctomycetota bacterium]